MQTYGMVLLSQGHRAHKHNLHYRLGDVVDGLALMKETRGEHGLSQSRRPAWVISFRQRLQHRGTSTQLRDSSMLPRRAAVRLDWMTMLCLMHPPRQMVSHLRTACTPHCNVGPLASG